MAEGSGSEASSVPSGPAAAPTVAAPPTATVSYAKIAAVTSDNDPAAAVIVVNPEVTIMGARWLVARFLDRMCLALWASGLWLG